VLSMGQSTIHYHTPILTSLFLSILHSWDLRFLSAMNLKNANVRVQPLFRSCHDPTIAGKSTRPRGIVSISQGNMATAPVFFALAMNSEIQLYSRTGLEPLGNLYRHPNMTANSFDIGLSSSPCGRWVAASSSQSEARVYLFDVENTTRAWETRHIRVQLWAPFQRYRKLDWSGTSLAICSTAGLVLVWYPDIEVYRNCQEAPVHASTRWSW
ncbi:uncharacterized protein EV420DRAFT_1243324, partial [Desarmillaria tabescens]